MALNSANMIIIIIIVACCDDDDGGGYGVWSFHYDVITCNSRTDETTSHAPHRLGHVGNSIVANRARDQLMTSMIVPRHECSHPSLDPPPPRSWDTSTLKRQQRFDTSGLFFQVFINWTGKSLAFASAAANCCFCVVHTTPVGYE